MIYGAFKFTMKNCISENSDQGKFDFVMTLYLDDSRLRRMFCQFTHGWWVESIEELPVVSYRRRNRRVISRELPTTSND